MYYKIVKSGRCNVAGAVSAVRHMPRFRQISMYDTLAYYENYSNLNYINSNHRYSERLQLYN